MEGDGHFIFAPTLGGRENELVSRFPLHGHDQKDFGNEDGLVSYEDGGGLELELHFSMLPWMAGICKISIQDDFWPVNFRQFKILENGLDLEPV